MPCKKQTIFFLAYLKEFPCQTEPEGRRAVCVGMCQDISKQASGRRRSTLVKSSGNAQSSGKSQLMEKQPRFIAVFLFSPFLTISLQFATK